MRWSRESGQLAGAGCGHIELFLLDDIAPVRREGREAVLGRFGTFHIRVRVRYGPGLSRGQPAERFNMAASR